MGGKGEGGQAPWQGAVEHTYNSGLLTSTNWSQYLLWQWTARAESLCFAWQVSTLLYLQAVICKSIFCICSLCKCLRLDKNPGLAVNGFVLSVSNCVQIDCVRGEAAQTLILTSRSFGHGLTGRGKDGLHFGKEREITVAMVTGPFLGGNLRMRALIFGSLPVTAGLIKVFGSAFAWHSVFKVNWGVRLLVRQCLKLILRRCSELVPFLGCSLMICQNWMYWKENWNQIEPFF